MTKNKRNILVFLALLVLLTGSFCGDICFGSVHIALSEWNNPESLYHDILFNFRLPKAITAILVGAAISVSGLLMQTMFHNPLAGPYVLGISSGASLGVALFLLGSSFFPFLLLNNSLGLIFSATIGAVCVLLLIMLFSLRLKQAESLLIVGIMLGQLAGAMVTILQNHSNPDSLKLFIVWSFGSLSSVSWTYMQVLLPLVLVGLLLVVILLKPLNALLLGEKYAQSLGFSIRKIHSIIIICVAILAGGTTAFTGPIAFIGMAVPHIARRLTNSDNHHITFPASILCGAILLLWCDIACQLPSNGHVLPINAVSALVGTPIIIWIIIKRKR